MDVFAKSCAQALARAHARSGDAIAISGDLGTGDTSPGAVARFAELSTDQNERDYAKRQAAADSGRIRVKN